MKYLTRIITIAACFGAMPTKTMHSVSAVNSPDLHTIRAVKELPLNPLTPVTVTIEQDGQKSSPVTFRRNTNGLKNQLFYSPKGGEVTITAQMANSEIVATYIVPNTKYLVGQEIHIVKDGNKHEIKLKPSSVKKSAPKKTPISASIENPLADYAYTIVITAHKEEKSKPITIVSKKLPSKNLYLRLNAQQETGTLAPYNANTITLQTRAPKKKIANQSVTITRGSWQDGYQIKVIEGYLTVVDAQGKQILRSAELVKNNH